MQKDDQTAPATKGDLMQMRSEMATKDDLNKFATKDDIRELKDILDVRFAQISEKFKEVDKGLKYANDGIDQVLVLVENVDKRLSGDIKTHGRQITRLKKKVGVR